MSLPWLCSLPADCVEDLLRGLPRAYGAANSDEDREVGFLVAACTDLRCLRRDPASERGQKMTMMLTRGALCIRMEVNGRNRKEQAVHELKRVRDCMLCLFQDSVAAGESASQHSCSKAWNE